jgi:hypothetical protein
MNPRSRRRRPSTGATSPPAGSQSPLDSVDGIVKCPPSRAAPSRRPLRHRTQRGSSTLARCRATGSSFTGPKAKRPLPNTTPAKASTRRAIPSRTTATLSSGASSGSSPIPSRSSRGSCATSSLKPGRARSPLGGRRCYRAPVEQALQGLSRTYVRSSTRCATTRRSLASYRVRRIPKRPCSALIVGLHLVRYRRMQSSQASDSRGGSTSLHSVVDGASRPESRVPTPLQLVWLLASLDNGVEVHQRVYAVICSGRCESSPVRWIGRRT